MISYPIETAKESGLFESIIVTTDDFLIGAIAVQYGAEHVSRPERLAQDECGTQEVARWVLKDCCAPDHYDYACVIYPCTPLMTADDLRIAAEEYEVGHPAFIYATGYFYWGRTQNFLDDVPITYDTEMTIPAYRYIDINTPEDWSRAEALYAALHPEVA